MAPPRGKFVALLALSLALLTPAVAAPAQAQVAGNPLEMSNGFYVDPESNSAKWVAQNQGHPDMALIRDRIATKAGARWFGNWSGDIGDAVNKFANDADVIEKLPVLVAYNIPGRDCGGHSGGGAGSAQAYKDWISEFSTALGGHPAIVIIEPDALAQLDCMSAAAQAERIELLKFAVREFQAKNPNTWAYMDGGNYSWIAANEMARRLKLVEVNRIRGFALNVSNYYTTSQSLTKGNAIKSALGGGAGSNFVVDTSRNGKGSNGEWCNPAGRQLGVTSQAGGGADMLLWIKVPGDSDGKCGIAPTVEAGHFSPVIAKRLIQGW
ncbi:glycoside hydrolase family 6 protein [Kribbella deserti]|uniref:Glucanase n=1 Tax=Kribbella deserti TaxID=1926257 RepID=A0ABV6QWJ9_9ACTN